MILMMMIWITVYKTIIKQSNRKQFNSNSSNLKDKETFQAKVATNPWTKWVSKSNVKIKIFIIKVIRDKTISMAKISDYFDLISQHEWVVKIHAHFITRQSCPLLTFEMSYIPHCRTSWKWFICEVHKANAKQISIDHLIELDSAERSQNIFIINNFVYVLISSVGV